MEPSKRGEEVKDVLGSQTGHTFKKQAIASKLRQQQASSLQINTPAKNKSTIRINFSKKKKNPYLKYWKTTQSLRASGPSVQRKGNCNVS